MANVPLVQDRMALRLVGTYLDDSGFIDNIARGRTNSAGNKTYSARVLLDIGITYIFAEILRCVM